MGLFKSSTAGSTSEDPETRQVEKMIATEAKNEQKTVDHALKDLSKLEKTHDKSLKAADKAQHMLDKAVKNENDTAKALNQAEHKHDNAISSQRNAYKTLELKRQQAGHLEQDLQQRKTSVDEIQQKKAASDHLSIVRAVRESKLAQIHQHAADRAGSRAGSTDLSAGPTHATDGTAQTAGTGTMGVDADGTGIAGESRA
ncbi:hypothetical protein EVJ58_g11103 [Rhodofomes roseus]|uniref:Uncharacterized protein n=1 Tax=Rhodofomes roseus TaxID=34475 RepID=A0A4Y9XKU2_9APHY|nr:hypothetical protein EVJ58_g11103 [Rhodofomes roseus]